MRTAARNYAAPTRRAAHTERMGEQGEPDATGTRAAASERFKRLPERIKVEDTVESTSTEPARDPEGGRDTDRDFMIRYGGGG